ncbi:hypothetical protein L596_012379 [Steinernema carpocapsae]|uniref:Uncharacterized protein n=1 Tax=Steinernema carpocapsae TaxID=34508 RepID=A0A4U5NXS0_STECR|nr:hypothetical protein L596_012379 [Steinernema carpocapsae]
MFSVCGCCVSNSRISLFFQKPKFTPFFSVCLSSKTHFVLLSFLFFVSVLLRTSPNPLIFRPKTRFSHRPSIFLAVSHDRSPTTLPARTLFITFVLIIANPNLLSFYTRQIGVLSPTCR